MAIQEQQRQTDDVDQAMLSLLGHRYGDGLVYLRNDREQQLFHEAVRLGLVMVRFDRARSRLAEMQSRDYLAAKHLP